MDEVYDADRIADLLLPLGGPYTPEAVVQTATTMAELVRRLNHATFGGGALRYPSHLYHVVGGIRSAAYGLEQTLRQLSTHLDRWTIDPRVGHDRNGDPSHTCAQACEELRRCAANLDAVTTALDTAHELTSHLNFDRSRPAPHRADGPNATTNPLSNDRSAQTVSPPAVAKTFDTPTGPASHRTATTPPAQRFSGRTAATDAAAEQRHPGRRTSR